MLIAFSISILLLTLTQTQIYDTSLYSLGNNLVKNHDFSTPDLGGSFVIFFSGGITGWTCTPECQLTSVPTYCSVFSLGCTNNYTQSLDLDGNSEIIPIEQNITITNTALYLLSVDWLPASSNTVGKTF